MLWENVTVKPTFVRPFIAVIGAVALSATLIGCSPAVTPEQELSSMSHAPGHISSREYKPIHLGQTQDTDRYIITFDRTGWTGNYMAGSMSKTINFYVMGTFTNKGEERYRLGSSSEAEFELDGTYALYATTDLLDNEIIREDGYVYPGETVSFITRTSVPTGVQRGIKHIVMPFTLFNAGFTGSGYATHSSDPIGQFILSISPESKIDSL